MDDRPQIRIEGEVPETAKGSVLRARLVGEIPDDVVGQWSKIGMGQAEEDVEGQSYRVGYLGQTEEDVEGHTYKWNGFAQVEEDVEGQTAKWGGLYPTEEEAKQATDGHLFAGAVLEISAEDGELVGRVLPSDDDVEGQTTRFGG